MGRYVIELSRELAGLPEAVDLHVCGLASDRHRFPWIPNSNWVEIPASAKGGVKNLLWHQVRLPGILRQHAMELVHIPSYRRILAQSPVPQIATIHDCAPFHLRDKYGLLRGIFGRILVPILARRCRHVLTVSHFTREDLIRFMKLSTDRVGVIWNGIDHDRYRPQSPEATGAFRASKGLGRKVFLYIARLEHPGKNHLRLIEAFERLFQAGHTDAELVLGGADWHGAEVIHERVRESSCSGRIHMAGFIEEAEMPLWYASAQSMVFPSLFEGFGLPVAEALACGTRVLCSNRASLPEVGGDAVSLFNPESVDELASTMQSALNEPPDVREIHINRGFAQAARFNWRTAAEQTCMAYHRLLTSEADD